MEPIILREATMADMPTLLQFEQGVIRAERPFDVTLGDDPINYYDLEQLIMAPHICLVVAVSGEELIGSGYARIETAKPYLRHTRFAYFGFMYVKETWRGKGVNSMIIDTLKEWIRNQGITEMRLEVYNENESALRAYEKAGFARHMIEMRMGV
jgi:ribosomal protein S18 acetylase RimI-like enzyme